MVVDDMPGAAEFDCRRYTLLVVDDSPTNLSVVVDYLADCGFQVIVARDGETALELAASEQPDLILLDVMLTGIDGFETCRRLKAQETTRHIMVVFMTVLTDIEDKIKGFQLGAVDYITKPFQQDELLARVTTHLQLKKLTGNLENLVQAQTKTLMDANRKLQEQIRESQRIQDALGESEARYRAVIENSNDGVAMVEAGEFVFVNSKLLEMTGRNEAQDLVGKPVGAIIHPDDREMITEYNRLREAGRPVPNRYEIRGQTLEGRTIYLDISAARIHYQDRTATLAFFKDVTQRKHLELQLQQAQKMEAIGTLAGGIAHDFNNILSAIVGHSELAMLDEGVSQNAAYHIRQVLTAGRRASELVQQILTFSRQKDLEHKPVKLSNVVQDSLKMLRASLPTTIDIQVAVADSQSTIMADATRIQQVLMNLCANAAHAMSDRGGILRVTLDPVSVEAGQYPHLKPGSHLKLSIADDGHGMNRQTLDRIFDPYFTTKKPGEGTGLGLAVVHGIVTSYGGEIQVWSQPEQGTRFDLLWPIVTTKADGDELERGLDNLPRGTERILFVDDDALVVTIIEKMLQHLGYQVTALASSLEAWQLFQTQPTDFDLVITDLTMPGLSGDALSEKMLQRRPGIPIIICTGYSDRLSQDLAQAMGLRRYLMKPLLIEDLAHAIREIFDDDSVK